MSRTTPFPYADYTTGATPPAPEALAVTTQDLIEEYKKALSTAVASRGETPEHAYDSARVDALVPVLGRLLDLPDGAWNDFIAKAPIGREFPFADYVAGAPPLTPERYTELLEELVEHYECYLGDSDKGEDPADLEYYYGWIDGTVKVLNGLLGVPQKAWDDYNGV